MPSAWRRGAAPAAASGRVPCIIQAARRWCDAGLTPRAFPLPLPGGFCRSSCLIRNAFCPHGYKREPRAGLVRGSPGTVPRTPLSLGNVNTVTVAPRSDATGNQIAFPLSQAHPFAREDPGKRDRASFRFCCGLDH